MWRSRDGQMALVAALAAVCGLVVLAGPHPPREATRKPVLTGDLAKPRSIQIDPRDFAPRTPTGLVTIRLEPSVSAPRPSFVAPLGPQMLGLRTEGDPVPGAPSPTSVARRLAQAPQAESGPLVLTPPAPPFRSTFDTTDFDTNVTNTGSVFIPPDSHGAAGPSHVVNVENVSVRFHQKNGTVDLDTSLADFFAMLTPVNFTFDPKVLYDQFAGRFVIVTLELVDNGVCATAPACTSRILVAVSDDSNPNGTWRMTAINSEINVTGVDRWTDYPGFAVDEEAVYITGNLFGFDNSGGAYGGVRLWVIDKGIAGGFYAGGTPIVTVFDPYAGGGDATTTQPAHIYGTAPIGVGTLLVSHSGLTDGTNEFVQVVRIDDPLGSPTFAQQFIAVGNIDDVAAPLPGAPQSGTGTLIATNDRRALDAVWRGNSLFMTATILPNFGPDAGEATAQWWEVDTSTLGALTLADQGQIGGEEFAGNAMTFFPSIAVNSANHVAIGFSVSAASIFPSSAFTVRSPQDPPGTTRTPRFLRRGTDFYIRTFGGAENRWGDYSGMAVDPSDDCFWVYNQHAGTRGTVTNPGAEDGRWITAWGHFCSTTFEPFRAGLEGGQAPGEGPLVRTAKRGAFGHEDHNP